MDLTKTVENLKKRGFTVSVYHTGAEAAAAIASSLHGKTIGIGGSVTIDTLGLDTMLAKDNTVYWHWKQQPTEEVRQKANAAEVYLSSANAIAETGEIVNIDGTGNRVASLMYGHERVIIIAGENKIAQDLERAIWRARNIASPLNAKRMGMPTPCAVSDVMKCYDCGCPQRLCRGMSILMEKMGGIPVMEVVLIRENLGY